VLAKGDWTTPDRQGSTRDAGLNDGEIQFVIPEHHLPEKWHLAAKGDGDGGMILDDMRIRHDE